MSIRREHLKALRLAKGMTAIDLAEKAGLTEIKVYNVERGRYRLSREHAARWSAVLGVPLEQAFPEHNEGGAV